MKNYEKGSEKMKDNPYFSIILPIYNVEKYLNRCIESILKQNFKDMEIILVDDESPDNCPQLCELWKKKDKRIKVIHKKNGGLGYARNSGLEIAQGQYIWFVDSDDTIAPGALKKIHEALLKNDNPDVIFFGYKRIDKKGDVAFEEIQNIKKKKYLTKNEITKELLPDFIFSNPNTKEEINICKSAWCCCIRNEIIQCNNIKFESERKYISEDYYFWLDNFDKFNSMVFLDDAYYLYYQNEDSLSLKYREDRFEKLKIFDGKMVELVNEHNYPLECHVRLKGLFISNLFGCLKSEIKNKKNIGFISSFQRFKSICQDGYVYDALDKYSCKNKSNGWKLFSFCIRRKLYMLLYLVLLMKAS